MVIWLSCKVKEKNQRFATGWFCFKILNVKGIFCFVFVATCRFAIVHYIFFTAPSWYNWENSNGSYCHDWFKSTCLCWACSLEIKNTGNQQFDRADHSANKWDVEPWGTAVLDPSFATTFVWEVVPSLVPDRGLSESLTTRCERIFKWRWVKKEKGVISVGSKSGLEHPFYTQSGLWFVFRSVAWWVVCIVGYQNNKKVSHSSLSAQAFPV